MLARRYETRLDEDGLITFEKVWSKRIDIKKKQFRHPEHFCIKHALQIIH